jgi:hypothetical protein
MLFLGEKERMTQRKLSQEELQGLIHESLVKVDGILTSPLSEDVIPEQAQYGVLLIQLITSMCLPMLDTNGLDDFCEKLSVDIKNLIPKLDKEFLAALYEIDEKDPSCAVWTADCLKRASKIAAEMLVGR